MQSAALLFLRFIQRVLVTSLPVTMVSFYLDKTLFPT